MSSLDLSNAGRPIEAGVILLDSMEILDLAPIDFLLNDRSLVQQRPGLRISRLPTRFYE
jgi:hypothetical protein